MKTSRFKKGLIIASALLIGVSSFWANAALITGQTCTITTGATMTQDFDCAVDDVSGQGFWHGFAADSRLSFFSTYTDVLANNTYYAFSNINIVGAGEGLNYLTAMLDLTLTAQTPTGVQSEYFTTGVVNKTLWDTFVGAFGALEDSINLFTVQSSVISRWDLNLLSDGTLSVEKISSTAAQAFKDPAIVFRANAGSFTYVPTDNGNGNGTPPDPVIEASAPGALGIMALSLFGLVGLRRKNNKTA